MDSGFYSKKFDSGNNKPAENIFNIALVFHDRMSRSNIDHIKIYNDTIFNKVNSETYKNNSKAYSTHFIKNNINETLTTLLNELSSQIHQSKGL
jgi:hypothetical protein